METTVTKLTLANGLQVFLKEIHTAPIISHWVWYRVGSRDEQAGITGISHWVEHMQFKGTSKYPAGVLDKAISRVGGMWNASTYMDWTTYFETVPAAEIELALDLEADRMVNSLFRSEDVASERTVIISERQGNENEPLFRLGEEVQSAAFLIHSYHHEVIGEMVDLQTMGRDDLFRHYRSYYVPNNALLGVAGDFDTGQMLERIRHHFEAIPQGSEPVRLKRPEPAQTGERRLVVEGPGETTYLMVVYHVPQASHPDFFPLMVLSSLLTGASSLSLFGGGISNKTSRLYRALIDHDLAVGVHGGVQATIDPYLYTITVTIHPQSEPDRALAAIDDEIHRLQDRPPSAQELERALKQARALFAYGSESISNQAFWLGFAEMYASYDWFTGFLDNLVSVSPLDIQRVAQAYLLRQNRVVGIYHPTGQPTGDEGEEAE